MWFRLPTTLCHLLLSLTPEGCCTYVYIPPQHSWSDLRVTTLCALMMLTSFSHASKASAAAPPRTSLLEADGVGAGGGVLVGLEVVQRHAELAQHGVAQLLQLACAGTPCMSMRMLFRMALR